MLKILSQLGPLNLDSLPSKNYKCRVHYQKFHSGEQRTWRSCELCVSHLQNRHVLPKPAMYQNHLERLIESRLPNGASDDLSELVRTELENTFNKLPAWS